MHPLISIIIPAYNSAQTLEAALDSIVLQKDFNLREMEILLIDDASTDETIQVFEKWMGRRPEWADRARLLRNPGNLGPAATRNHGLRQAQAEWIAFLDADDVWLPTKLAIQFQCVAEQPEIALWCGKVSEEELLVDRCQVDGWETGDRSQRSEDRRQETGGQKKGVGVGCSVEGETAASREKGVEGREQIGAGGLPCEVLGRSRERSSHIPNEQPDNLTTQRRFSNPDGPADSLRLLTLDEFSFRNPVATSTVLVRRGPLLDVGGFDSAFRGPEDYDLWMRLAAQHRLALIDRPLSYYRRRPGSLSMDDRTFLPQVLRVFEKAYGPGGVLSGRSNRRPALAWQMLMGAWMAGERRAWGAAWGWFFKACWMWPWPFPPVTHHRWPRLKLMKALIWRYVRAPSATRREKNRFSV